MTKTISKWQDGDIVALVDIGSHNIVVLIVKMLYSQQKIELLASDTKGIGILLTQDGDLEESPLVGIIYSMEEKYDFHVKNIAISVGGGHLKFENIQCGFSFDYAVVINHSHIVKIEKYCLDKKQIKNNETIVDLFNNYYSLDMGINVLDPINIATSSIKGNYLVIYANQTFINKIYKYITKNKLDIIAYISTAQASAIAVMKKEEKFGFCIVVSIGSSDTAISILKNGYIIKIGHIQVGGNTITNDIIKTFGVSLKNAEAMKVAASNINNNEDVILSRDYFETLSKEQTIRASDVQQVIYKNTKEIFLKISEFIKENLKSQPIPSIILTGGMGNMLNIEELGRIILKTNCRIGIVANPSWIVSNSEEWQTKMLKNPSFTAVFGMGKYLLQRYNQKHLTKSSNWIWNRIYKISSFVEDFFY